MRRRQGDGTCEAVPEAQAGPLPRLHLEVAVSRPNRSGEKVSPARLARLRAARKLTAKVRHIAARGKGAVTFGHSLTVSLCGASNGPKDTIILAAGYATCPNCRRLHGEHHLAVRL